MKKASFKLKKSESRTITCSTAFAKTASNISDLEKTSTQILSGNLFFNVCLIFHCCCRLVPHSSVRSTTKMTTLGMCCRHAIVSRSIEFLSSSSLSKTPGVSVTCTRFSIQLHTRTQVQVTQIGKTTGPPFCFEGEKGFAWVWWQWLKQIHFKSRNTYAYFVQP